MKIHLKTPISYYGGKQNLVTTILPLIQPHNLYCEPFCGGAAVFWAKEPSPVEVINDINEELINFYRVLQSRFDDLWAMVQNTMHSRRLHNDADVIYKHPHLFGEVDRAWALWVQTNQSFTSKISGGWAYGRQSNVCEKKTNNQKDRFRELYRDRLKHVQVECNEALKVITSRDTPETFFYLDPPYPDTNLGHYGGYNLAHFEELLAIISRIQGKFLLSSYDYPLLAEYAKRNGWYQIRKEFVISAKKGKRDKKKTEVLTANYPI